MHSKIIDEFSQAYLPASVQRWVGILNTIPNSNFLYVYLFIKQMLFA